jgi:hypothetical protein
VWLCLHHKVYTCWSQQLRTCLVHSHGRCRCLQQSTGRHHMECMCRCQRVCNLQHTLQVTQGHINCPHVNNLRKFGNVPALYTSTGCCIQDAIIKFMLKYDKSSPRSADCGSVNHAEPQTALPLSQATVEREHCTECMQSEALREGAWPVHDRCVSLSLSDHHSGFERQPCMRQVLLLSRQTWCMPLAC